MSLFVSTVVSILALQAGVLAQSHGRDMRDVQSTLLPHSITLDSVSLNASRADAIIYNFGTDGAPHVRQFYFKSSNISGNISAVSYTFMSSLVRIVECNDSIPYKDSTSYINLWGHPFTWTNISPFNVTADDGTTTISGFQTNLTLLNGFFIGFKVYLAPKTVSVNGVAYAYNGLKYSVYISGFPYTYTNSRLAFQHVIFTSASSRNVNSSSLMLDDKGRFDWVTSMSDASGTSVSVTVDTNLVANSTIFGLIRPDSDDNADPTKGQETAYVITHTAAAIQPSVLYWDPTVGVQDDTVNSGAFVVRAAAILPLVVALISIFLM